MGAEGEWFSASAGSVVTAAGLGIGFHEIVEGIVTTLTDNDRFIEGYFPMPDLEAGQSAETTLIILMWGSALALNFAMLVATGVQTHTTEFITAVVAIGIGAPMISGIVSALAVRYQAAAQANNGANAANAAAAANAQQIQGMVEI